MRKEELWESLALLCQKREDRHKLLAFVHQNPKSIAVLMEMIFLEEKEYGLLVGWSMDLVIQEDLYVILPFLDDFCQGIPSLRNQSAIRTMSKICATLMEFYYHKKDPKVIRSMKVEYRKIIAEVSFDWLLGEHKVAAKVFSMSSLYELGKEFDWIHPELEIILQRGYASGSVGYRSRARKVLERLSSTSV